MAAFLLWNVKKKPLDTLVQNLVQQHQIDVVLLVEYAFGVSQLPWLLLADGDCVAASLALAEGEEIGLVTHLNKTSVKNPTAQAPWHAPRRAREPVAVAELVLDLEEVTAQNTSGLRAVLGPRA